MVNEKQQVRDISLDYIDDPILAIRSEISDDGLDTLISSIRLFGVLQPILVKSVGERFEVIAGHRRLLACRALGLLTIPVIVCDVDDTTSEVMKMHENFCREDVNIVDEAIFLETVMAKNNFSPAELAELINRSEAYVRTRLDMKHWDPAIRDAVWRNDISASAAKWINQIGTDSVRRDWLNIAIRGGITAAQAQHWYQQWSAGALPDEPTTEIVEQLADGLMVSVKHVECTLCGEQMPLIDAMLFYGHKTCADYWKVQQQINKSAIDNPTPKAL